MLGYVLTHYWYFFDMLKFFISAIIILACLFLGKLMAYSLNLGFPSTIIGMLILFGLLISGVIKPHLVLPCSEPLLKYMPLLFIPTLVGVIEHLALIKTNLIIISVSVIASCTITLAIVGHVFQKLNNSKS